LERSSFIKNQYFKLAIVILLGLLTRLYFHIGHIFSDDAYYSFLSYSLSNGDFANEYLGYPVFPLRIGFISLVSLSMMIFGNTEFATIVFSLLFSLLNIILTYKLIRLITNNEKVSLISAFLIAFFPTDIIFATIGFPDLINTFLINLGIYLLLKSYLQKKSYIMYLGGVSFFLSMQFKENAYYFLILLFILLIYFLLRKKQLVSQLVIGIIFIVGNYLIEGFVYFFLHNDFLYRLTITNANFNYSYYDFFPYTAQKLSTSKNYLKNLFDQIFLINAKSIFLRRFYLFLPIVSVVQTFFSLKKKENNLILFWFLGLAILLITFTTSFTEYKPLDLARSWYIYPLMMPMIILSSLFINRFSNHIRNGLIVIYILGSLIMCFEYTIFFQRDNLNSLKIFLQENSSKTIYTDHFTNYSVDLIRDYKTSNSQRILGEDFDFSQIPTGDWILFNKKHIDELKLQKYQFPDFYFLNTTQFKKIASFSDFEFYEKLP